MKLEEFAHNYLVGEYVKQLNSQVEDLEENAKSGDIEAQIEVAYIQDEIKQAINMMTPWQTEQ